MTYTAIEYFTDLQDNGYEYKVGDAYPREGYTPSAERVEALASNKNVRNRPIIALVEEPVSASKTLVIEEAEEPAEKPKKRKKREE